MKRPEILLIDNYDSFTHNLGRYVDLAGAHTTIVRNDAITIKQIETLKPCGIILSPGPDTPAKAGISTDIIRKLGAATPILGICLGHQCIGEAYGGETIQSSAPLHGRSSKILHEDNTLFKNIPSPFEGGRYHSLTTDITNAPDLKTIARAAGTGAIMAIQHTAHPVYGVQFHPESILTEHGHTLIDNFIDIIIAQKHPQ